MMFVMRMLKGFEWKFAIEVFVSVIKTIFCISDNLKHFKKYLFTLR